MTRNRNQEENALYILLISRAGRDNWIGEALLPKLSTKPCAIHNIMIPFVSLTLAVQSVRTVKCINLSIAL